MRWNGSVLGRYVAPVRGANQGIWDLITAGLLQKANLWSTQAAVVYNVSSSTSIPAQNGAGDLTATASTGYFSFSGNYNFGGAISISCVAGQNGGQAGIRQDAATFFKAASFSAVGSFGSAGNNSQYPVTIDTSDANGAISLDIYNGLGGHTYAAYTSMTAIAGTGTITLSGNQAGKGPNPYPHYFTGGIVISSSCSINLATLNATATSSITGNISLYGIVVCNISPSVTMTVSGVLSTATYNAGSFVSGQWYEILTVGTTSWTSIGAASNTTGVVFLATGAGTGTGTAKAFVGITKNGTGTLALNGNNTYNAATTINAGTLTVNRSINSVPLAASFTNSSITVDFFGSTPPAGTYRIFPGSTSMGANPTLTLLRAGSATGSYNQSTSTLTIN